MVMIRKSYIIYIIQYNILYEYNTRVRTYFVHAVVVARKSVRGARACRYARSVIRAAEELVLPIDKNKNAYDTLRRDLSGLRERERGRLDGVRARKCRRRGFCGARGIFGKFSNASSRARRACQNSRNAIL